MSDGASCRKIVSIPSSEVPYWIREAWIGLELFPCYPPSISPAYGLISKERTKTSPGFNINMRDALELLDKHAPDAGRWWRKFLRSEHIIISTHSFVFDAACSIELPPDDGYMDMPIKEIKP